LDNIAKQMIGKVVKLVNRYLVLIVVRDVSQTRGQVGQSNLWMGGLVKLVVALYSQTCG